MSQTTSRHYVMRFPMCMPEWQLLHYAPVSTCLNAAKHLPSYRVRSFRNSVVYNSLLTPVMLECHYTWLAIGGELAVGAPMASMFEKASG